MAIGGKYQVTETMLLRANIPKGYWGLQLTSIDDLTLRNKMMDVAADMEKFLTSNVGVLLVGPMRTGKSAFANILLRGAMSLGAKVQYARTYDVVSWWRKEWDKSLNPLCTLEEKVLACDLVVFDDLGLEPPGVASQNLLEYALRKRYENNTSSIVVTNLSLPELQRLYTPTFMSVLQRACSRFLVVKTKQWEVAPREY